MGTDMDLSEDTASGRLCKVHNVPTLLSCAQCDEPVCPRCTVWTVVGQKCTTCTGTKLPTAQGARRFIRPAVIVGVLLAAVVAVRFLGSDSVQRTNTRFNVPAAAPTVEMGEQAIDRGLSFVVNSFECGGSELGEGPRRLQAAGQYCTMDLTVSNKGTEPAAYSGTSQLLVDSDGNTYAPDGMATSLASASANRPPSTFQQLNPGIEIKGLLVFDIPKATVPTEAELHGLGSGLRLSSGRAGGARVLLPAGSTPKSTPVSTPSLPDPSVPPPSVPSSAPTP